MTNAPSRAQRQLGKVAPSGSSPDKAEVSNKLQHQGEGGAEALDSQGLGYITVRLFLCKWRVPERDTEL